MRRRTMVHGGLGLLVTASMALASGCTDDRDRDGGNTAMGDAPPTSSPAQQLSQAITRLQQDTYRMTMTLTIDGQRGRLTGSMDPTRNIGAFTATIDRKDAGPQMVTQWRVIGDVMYMNTAGITGLPGSKGKPWRRLNPGATTGADWYDGAQMASALQKATSVRRVDDKSFEGTLDPAASAKAIGVPTPTASSTIARVIPFEARVDNTGRLIRYSLDTPTNNGGTDRATIVFADFGAPVNVQPPPAEQIRSN